MTGGQRSALVSSAMARQWDYLIAFFADGRWQYIGPSSIRTDFGAELGQMLQACGQEGWELVCLAGDSWIFKRPSDWTL